MRLDNDQTMLVRMVARVSQWFALRFADVQVEGLEHVPAHGRGHPRGQPRRPTRTRSWPAPGSATPCGRAGSTGWASASCSTGRSSAGSARTAASTRWTAATADVEAYRLATRILESGLRPAHLPRGHAQPHGRPPGGQGRPGAAGPADRRRRSCPIGVNDSDAVWPKGHKLPSPFPRRTDPRADRGAVPRRATSCPPAPTAGPPRPLATTAIMGRIAELLEPRHRGVYAYAVREPSAGRHAAEP